MRWITSRAACEALSRSAAAFLDVDSDREETTLRRLVFSDAAVQTEGFFAAVQALLRLSGAPAAYFIAFEVVFCAPPRMSTGRAALEILAGDAAQDYLAYLSGRGLPWPGSPGAEWMQCMVFEPWEPGPEWYKQPALTWFACATRSDRDDTGHLWLPPEWTAQAVAAFPGLAERRGTRLEMEARSREAGERAERWRREKGSVNWPPGDPPKR